MAIPVQELFINVYERVMKPTDKCILVTIEKWLLANRLGRRVGESVSVAPEPQNEVCCSRHSPYSQLCTPFVVFPLSQAAGSAGALQISSSFWLPVAGRA